MTDQYSALFIDALINQDLKALRKIPKPDLHTHGYLSGTVKHLQRTIGRILSNPPTRFDGLDGMERWARSTLDQTGLYKSELFRACFTVAFLRAADDGLSVMDVDVNIRHIEFFADRTIGLVKCLDSLCKNICPSVQVNYIAGITWTDEPHKSFDLLQECLDTGAFYGIDLYGKELARPLVEFIPHYNLADKKSLIKKAHIGETGEPKSILETLDVLDLDQIQHGFRAAECSRTMKELSSRGTMLNICPECNIVLGLVKSLSAHPLRKLFEEGVLISIATDNSLVTNKGLSEDYLNIYFSDLFSAEQLDSIRF